MFKENDRHQQSLLPQSIDEYVGPNELPRFIVTMVKALDIQPLVEKYSNLGQNAFHPKMMLALMFYAYSRGITSSRDIAENVRYDLRYKYITGGLEPNFRTINNFRKDNLSELRRYFVDIIMLCKRLNLVKLNKISLDGTKISASASSKNLRDRDTLAKEIKQVEAQIDHLLAKAQVDEDNDNDDDDSSSLIDIELAELKTINERLQAARNVLDKSPNQKRINLTDIDCREQGKTGSGYNCQAVVDCDSQIILCTEVVSMPVDNEQLLPLINQVEVDTETVGQPKQVYADSGYESGANFVELEKKPHIEAFVASKRQDLHSRQPELSFRKANFHFDVDTLECYCPLGKTMKLKQCRERNGVLQWDYIGIDCKSCLSRHQCTNAKLRHVSFTSADASMQKMRDKMETRAGKAAMRLRRQTVEPVFGQMKRYIKGVSFSLRGMTKVQGEFTLMAIVHNLKKMHKFLPFEGLDCLLMEKSHKFASFWKIFSQTAMNHTICFTI